MKAIYNASGKKFVIVGANSGIGQALTHELLDCDATVFGIDIQKDSLIVTTPKYFYFKANPLEKNDLDDVFTKIDTQVDQINGLVNLSGTIIQFKAIESLTSSDWDETYDISFKSCFNACKVVTPLLRNAQKAAIVNMASGLAFIGQKNYGPYSAAKAAVVSFTKTLAAELAPAIRVNSVAPGAVNTNFIYKEDGGTRFDKDQYIKMVPLKSLARPEEISSVILFLLSESASHITGQCIHINGGAGMH